jgi:hypothetical protein
MKKSLIAAVVTAGAIFALASPAAAERPESHTGNPKASCAGLGLSEHAVNDGAGAIAAAIEEVQAAADEFGFDNAGQIVSEFAQVHAGTHVPGCEDAFYAILLQG